MIIAVVVFGELRMLEDQLIEILWKHSRNKGKKEWEEESEEEIGLKESEIENYRKNTKWQDINRKV